MMPAHFLHIFGTFDLGGAEARTVALMRAFGGAAQHSVLVADQGALSARAAIPVTVDVVFPDQAARLVSGYPTPTRLWRIAQSLRGHDLILTYAWGAMDVVLAHRLFARALRLPPLVHHEDGFGPSPSTLIAAARSRFRRLALRGPNAIVVPSLSLEAHARDQWRVRPDRLVRITNGIPMGGNGATTPIPGLRRKDEETLVCTIAGLRPEKNLRRLVRVGAAAGPDIRVAILGEGPERGAILAEADRLGCADRIDLAGFVEGPGACLPTADIFALSSDTEQGPIALIEAMAAGLPVVATDVGDVAAMVAPENLPFVVPAADEAGFARAIRRLADDPALRTQIGQANAAKARRDFDATHMEDAYRRLYWSFI